MKVNIAILTVTDTRTFDSDKSGAILVKKIEEASHNLIDRKICKDEKEDIKKILQVWINKKDIDVIITTGGTGLTGRDNTIDNIKSISEIEIPGFGELFRQISFQKIGTSAIQSRSSAFLVNKTYVFCLPGSKSAVQDAWKEILFYQLDIRHKPCNFVELIPRLDE